jgi:hypothetical protein
MKSWTKAVMVSLALAIVAIAVAFPACALNG